MRCGSRRHSHSLRPVIKLVPVYTVVWYYLVEQLFNFKNSYYIVAIMYVVYKKISRVKSGKGPSDDIFMDR